MIKYRWIWIGNENAVEALIKNGANVSLVNGFGDRAIDKAALFGNTECTRAIEWTK